jgi:6-phosphogluconolactonase (cycloisomerase 2 family)
MIKIEGNKEERRARVKILYELNAFASGMYVQLRATGIRKSLANKKRKVHYIKFTPTGLLSICITDIKQDKMCFVTIPAYHIDFIY